MIKNSRSICKSKNAAETEKLQKQNPKNIPKNKWTHSLKKCTFQTKFNINLERSPGYGTTKETKGPGDQETRTSKPVKLKGLGQSRSNRGSKRSKGPRDQGFKVSLGLAHGFAFGFSSLGFYFEPGWGLRFFRVSLCLAWGFTSLGFLWTLSFAWAFASLTFLWAWLGAFLED